MKHIAIYMRVSTDAQSTDSQEHEIRKYLIGRGLDPDDASQVVWYIDKISGSEIKREALNRLKLRAEAGAVSEIIVWKLDRLSRRMVDGINLIHNWLEAGIAVVSITQQFDFRGPLGKAVAALLLALAEAELMNIRERVKAGIARARANGKKWGGWQKGRARKQALKDRMVQIEGMWMDGKSATEISNATGVSRSYIYVIVDRLRLRERKVHATRRNENVAIRKQVNKAIHSKRSHSTNRTAEIINKVADALLPPPEPVWEPPNDRPES